MIVSNPINLGKNKPETKATTLRIVIISKPFDTVL